MVDLELICTRLCGFRVPVNYYAEEPRFAPTCARCYGPIAVVTAYTDNVSSDWIFNHSTRRIENIA